MPPRIFGLIIIRSQGERALLEEYRTVPPQNGHMEKVMPLTTPTNSSSGAEKVVRRQ